MNRPVSRLAIIAAIVRKDLGEYRRDKLWAFLTIMVLIVVIGLFWLTPDEVNESIQVGVSGLDDSNILTALESAEEEGLLLVPFGSAEWLEAVVGEDATSVPPRQAGTAIGIAFPEDFLTATAGGDATVVTVFVDAGVPDEIRVAITSLVRELAFTVAGEDLPINTLAPDEVFVVLGDDRVGNQASARDSFRPVLVFLVLLMEMFIMASLIAKEIQDRTVTALLVTPATVGDVLAAKGIVGALSGMAQAVIVLIAINSLSPHPLLILTLMFLGAVMVSGTAMLAGSTGKDFMGTLFSGMLFMIPLMIPAFAALFPGTASTWIRAIPSYPLVKGLVDVSTFGDGWAETLPELGTLLVWCIALFALGWTVLKRKVQTL